MKLVDCIIMGQFMGLQTVEECINNYTFHYTSLLPYKQAVDSALELNAEFKMYENGTLEIDWHYVQEQVDKQNKELEKYMEDWQSGNATGC
jgi:hypothetical protein